MRDKRTRCLFSFREIGHGLSAMQTLSKYIYEHELDECESNSII